MTSSSDCCCPSLLFAVIVDSKADLTVLVKVCAAAGLVHARESEAAAERWRKIDYYRNTYIGVLLNYSITYLIC